MGKISPRTGIRKQIDALPPRAQAEIVPENKWVRRIIHDLHKPTHLVRIAPTSVYIQPVSMNHSLIIGQPDSETNPGFETGIYVADHGNILISGRKKDDLHISIESDEHPTWFSIDKRIGEKLVAGVRTGYVT